jgi:Gene product 88
METLRNLLQQGNTKLGEGIYTFSLPAILTCPGASPSCRKECYALRGRFIFLRRSYQRYLSASKEDGFTARMISEICRRWAGCVRIHVSGDYYSAEYVRKWIAIARACPTTRFFAYTRSWRRADMAEALTELSRCRNVRLWYSCDRDTGIPARPQARQTGLDANQRRRLPAPR